MIEIIYKDEDLIVCVKPSGILSVEDSSKKENLMNLVRQGLSVTENKNLYPVHRLDRETSGLMVFARNTKSAAVLSEDIANHIDFKKEYLLVLKSIPRRMSEYSRTFFLKILLKIRFLLQKMNEKALNMQSLSIMF